MDQRTITAELLAAIAAANLKLNQLDPRDLVTPSPAPSGPPPLLLTVDAAAECLAISRSTLYKMISTGEIRIVKLGAATRIPTTVLTDYVQHLLDQAPAAERDDQSDEIEAGE